MRIPNNFLIATPFVARSSHAIAIAVSFAVAAQGMVCASMPTTLWNAGSFVPITNQGGYFLGNGATLCDDGTLKSCHLKAEATLVSCEDIRKAAKIDRVILPDHLYADQKYTKWGDPLLDDGRRMRGELFWDESVQKILAEGGVLRLYTKYVRHPRTYHLPFSPKVQIGDVGDDRVMPSTAAFEGKRVIVTVKMDGSQATAYSDYLHGRTVDFKSRGTGSRISTRNSRTRFRRAIG